MKRITALFLAILLLGSASVFAQTDTAKKDEGYVFTVVKELPVTSVKDQHRAGTCWCYSGLGFIEAELLRMGKGEYDLSEMFIVYNTYLDCARA
ncbi:MAG: aminopeptidase, partial [Bacteroidales bacterium]|nr:aminopeptidase [Bacteroidales bacterium]